MLNRGGEYVVAIRVEPVLHQAEQRNVITLRRAARENDLVGLCPKHFGNLFTGVIHSPPGCLAKAMRPASSVSHLRQVIRRHRLEHPWIHRRGRIVVEVDSLHVAKHLFRDGDEKGFSLIDRLEVNR